MYSFTFIFYMQQIRKDSFITHRAFCDALAEESARITTVPTSLSNFRRDHMTNAHQGPRIPHILPGFHSEFGGSGSSEPLGNHADSDHKLKIPLRLDQANSQLHHPLISFPNKPSGFSLGANSACTMPDLVQTVNMFGSPPQQAQWPNYRSSYPEASSFTSANMAMLPPPPPHGLKQEQEENKGDLYFGTHNTQGGPVTHMSATALLQKATQIGATRINNNNNNVAFNNNHNVFDLMGSNLSSISSNKNSITIGELVNLEATNNNNLGGGFPLNDSKFSNFLTVNNSKNLDHMVVPMVNQERRNRGPSSIMDKQLRSSRSNDKDELGLTRDFLGVGDESISRPFLQQELAEFSAIGSAMDLQSQYGGHYC